MHEMWSKQTRLVFIANVKRFCSVFWSLLHPTSSFYPLRSTMKTILSVLVRASDSTYPSVATDSSGAQLSTSCPFWNTRERSHCTISHVVVFCLDIPS